MSSFCPLQRRINTHFNQFIVMISGHCLSINLTPRNFLLPFLSNQTTKNTGTHNEQVMFSDYTRRGRW
uniref:Uncharacterized protein n=1 Tax=Lotus japonicus TaxID=34305 RepID=I3T4S3_LOTJA|nr:unknown [Lotus japonicus]